LSESDSAARIFFSANADEWITLFCVVERGSGLDSTSPTLLLRLKASGAAREVAWSEFRQRYAPIVAGFARNLGASPQDVDDLIQEVMTGFYAAQPSFRYDPLRGRFRGYLKTCVVHLLARKAKARQLHLDGRPVEEIDPADDRIDHAWESSWEQEQLARAIDEVRKHYDDNTTFNAFLRVAVHNEPVEHVAQELGLSVDSVYKAKSRCMLRLKSSLQQIQDEEE
jgi:RNA polymerase sigma factor (sigma-70 family)